MSNKKSLERLLAYDHQGMPTGIVARDDAHILGIPHASVHLFAVDDNNNLIAQQREEDKINPLCWDYTVAGHMKIDEKFWRKTPNSIDTAKFRMESILMEAKEEMKFDLWPGNLFFIGTALWKAVTYAKDNPKGIMDINLEYGHMFGYRISDNEVKKMLQNIKNKKTDGEVKDAKKVPLQEYIEQINEDRAKISESAKNKTDYKPIWVPRDPLVDLAVKAFSGKMLGTI